MAKVYYCSKLSKEKRENLYDVFKPENYVEQYGITLDTAKNIICRTFLEDGGLDELESYMIDAGERIQKQKSSKKETHKIKTEKPKSYTIDNADLCVICHFAVTYLLSDNAGKDYEKKEKASIEGDEIKWFDVLALSSIYQAYREGFGNSKGYISIKRLYEIIYGRKINVYNSMVFNDFCNRIYESFEKWRSFEGDFVDADGNSFYIDDKFYVDGEIADKGYLVVKHCKLMELVEQRHCLNVISNAFLGESRCLTQEVKSYIIYRLNQKTGHNQGRIKRCTLDRVIGKKISDFMLDAVLKQMPAELKCNFDNSTIFVEVR